ncbi:MAG: fasciclin domain-containing protein, partial [Cyclobacteriaceae bacterium]
MMKLIKVFGVVLFALTLSSQTFAQDKTIVGLAAGNNDLSTLVTAVKAAGLVDVLNGEGPFTVFAPTNEAFASLPDGVLENLLKPENKDKLKAVLTYHVVGGNVKSTDLKNGMVKTVEGSNVE